MSSVHGEGDDPQDNDQGQDEGEAVDVEPPGLEVLTELQGPGTKPAIREHPDHDEASQHRESLYYNTDLGGSVSVHCVRGQRLQVIYYHQQCRLQKRPRGSIGGQASSKQAQERAQKRAQERVSSRERELKRENSREGAQERELKRESSRESSRQSSRESSRESSRGSSRGS